MLDLNALNSGKFNKFNKKSIIDDSKEVMKFLNSFDFITKKLKDKIENSYKDSDVLNGISIFLKSIGMDKYEESAIGGGSWEDLLLKIKEDNLNQEKKEPKIIEYEVKVPEIPEHIRIAKEKANKESKGLYD